MLEGIHDLRAICSAPGKVILFGEHAVVYGHPAIAAATNQRTLVEADRCGDRFTVNGYRIHERYHSYLLTAVERVWGDDDPVRLQTEGGVPSASGTGSSAALTVAAVGALHQLRHQMELPQIAQDAFSVERATQGGGSPTDTSVSTAGGGIAISGTQPEIGEKLWDLSWEDQSWHVERVPMPKLTVVVGNSGVKGKTDLEVAKVARAVKKNAMLRDTLVEIGDITRQAVAPLAAKDWGSIGELMNRTHGCLHTLGVNHPAVQRLVEGVRDMPGTFGAKITGAGGGGSMICLTENPESVAARIKELDGRPYIVELGGEGIAWQE